MATTMPTFNQPVPGQAIPGPQPTYPTPQVQTNHGASSGGLVNVTGQVQDAMANEQNRQNQAQQMQRATQAYKEQQADNAGQSKASGLPPPAGQTQTGNGSGDFFHSIASSPVGQAIGSFINMVSGGGKGAIPDPNAGGGVGPPAAAATPAPPAMQGPPAPMAQAGAAPPQQIQGQMSGGAVQEPNYGTMGVNPQFMRGPVLAFENGGPIPASSMGVTPASPMGIPGFENGGEIPAPPMSIAAPQPAAQQAFDAKVESLHQDWLDHTLDDQGVPNKDQGVPSAASVTDPASPSGASPVAAGTGAPPTPGAPALQGAVPAPPAAGSPPNSNVDGSAAGNVPPTGTEADAAPSAQQTVATAGAVQQAAQNPAAQQGVAEESPGSQGKPHSIAPEQWAAWDKNIDEAVGLAAQAGRDPGQVRAALEANRNAWVQGHVLRNLSSANVALLNGDQKGVEKALKDAYYYMPDGRDMTINKDAQGNLQYQDPVTPYVNAQGKTSTQPAPGFKPNMIPVDAAHIQMLGTAMLDPMQVQDTIQNIRVASAKMELEHSQSQAAMMTGEGNLRKGTGIQMEGTAAISKADTLRSRAASENYKDFSEGDKARAGAEYLKFHVQQLQKTQRLDPSQVRKMDQASAAYDSVTLGRKTVEPDMLQQGTDKKGNPVMGPNPRAGSVTYDTKAVPAGAEKLTPEQHAYNKAQAQNLIAANPDMPPDQAAYLALQMSLQAGKKHDGKPAVLIDKTNPGSGGPTGHVYDPRTKQYINFHLTADGAASAAGGQTQVDPAALAAALQGSGGGGAGIPSQSEPDRSETPDMEPQSFPAES